MYMYVEVAKQLFEHKKANFSAEKVLSTVADDNRDYY